MLVKIAGEKVREWKCSRCQREKNFSIDVTQSAQQKLSIFDDAQLLCLVVKILPDYKRIEWLYSDVNKLIESMMFESKTIIGKTNNRQRLRLSLHGFAHETRLYLPDSLLTCERERRPFCRFFPINNLLSSDQTDVNKLSLSTNYRFTLDLTATTMQIVFSACTCHECAVITVITFFYSSYTWCCLR